MMHLTEIPDDFGKNIKGFKKAKKLIKGETTKTKGKSKNKQ